ncbi:MAG: ABC transporter permease [Armatimonadetes bacterium]|nr:ABC transporter permease [Armatimonadota bacterium]
MGRFILRRLLWSLFVLWSLSLVTFTVTYLVPADPARTLAGPQADPQTVASIRHELGLDRPFPVQYARYFRNALRGDFGRSYQTLEPVLPTILGRFPATALLAAAAFALQLILGIALGVLMAVRQGTWADRALAVMAVAGLSAPTFWVGLLFLYFLAYRLGWFPLGGYGTPAHVVLPACTLALGGMCWYARLLRPGMIEALHQDYIRTAQAKGLRKSRILFRHALRNALIPLVTIAGIDLGSMLGGLVLTEGVFQWPGIGRLAVEAITSMNVPMIMGTVLFSAILIVFTNLMVDTLYVYLDPRIRLE